MIKPSGFFNTPDTWEDLEKWILQHSRDQHVSLLTSAHMARNYTIKQIQEDDKVNRVSLKDWSLNSTKESDNG